MSTLNRSDPEGDANFNGVGRGGVRTCGDDAPLGGKRGSQTVRLTDEGWQKVMPNQIELWDIFVFDSFNKRGGHVAVTGGQGRGQWGLAHYPEEGVGGGGGEEYTGPCGVTVMSATIIVCCNFLSN